MDEMLFHTSLRNAGLFLTLSFTSLVYYHKNHAPKMREVILCISLIFNIISFKIAIELLKKSDQQIPKYLVICNVILVLHFLNVLLFKNK